LGLWLSGYRQRLQELPPPLVLLVLRLRERQLEGARLRPWGCEHIQLLAWQQGLALRARARVMESRSYFPWLPCNQPFFIPLLCHPCLSDPLSGLSGTLLPLLLSKVLNKLLNIMLNNNLSGMSPSNILKTVGFIHKIGLNQALILILRILYEIHIGLAETASGNHRFAG